jgi:hypothetical protein
LILDSGRPVRRDGTQVLVDEVKPPGNYVVEFDGSGLASGVYLYMLVVGGFSETKRMTLMR